MKITSNPSTTKKNKTGSWRTFKPEVDFEKCIGCGNCVKFCPEGIIEMNKNKKPEIDFDYCKGCGICASECPVKAIKMNLDKK